MIDGGLRQIFRTHLPDAFWQSIETGSTGRGIPDSHYIFPGGVSGWIEYKATKANAVAVRPEQIAWLERYRRNGGRAFVAVRTRSGCSLFDGLAARSLAQGGCKAVPSALLIGLWAGGPSGWDWAHIRTRLVK